MTKPEGPGLPVSDEVEVTVEKLIAGGDGLARYQGIPLLIPRSAPGDRLRVRIVERHRDYGRAEIEEVLEPGPGRREPPCPFFARCGGCDLQHLADELQSRLKVQAAAETLERFSRGKLPPSVRLETGAAWGYRLRTQLHVEPAGDRKVVGYRARKSHQLVAVDRCPVLVPELERELPHLASVLGSEAPRRLDLAAGNPGQLTVSPPLPGLPSGEVELEVGGLTYAYDARVFFQTHRELLPRLVESVVGGDRGEAAYDLYSGAGLFGLALARRYRRVVMVEGDRVAVRFARANARRNQLESVEVVAQAVESWVSALPPLAERVVVDPPRAGLSLAVRKALLEKLPRRLTYVSCHPASLARDLAALGKLYRVDSVVFVDLFPQTGHLETVVQLSTEAPLP
ncbi:MAG TPA: class I SAM-dependent RNA methyltransferase, partial [Thermoanaerobaculia bacterium]|nr:class I SAM-dependent RNA methyltransferase [Thermoanaerobaculia bacterium]